MVKKKAVKKETASQEPVVAETEEAPEETTPPTPEESEATEPPGGDEGLSTTARLFPEMTGKEGEDVVTDEEVDDTDSVEQPDPLKIPPEETETIEYIDQEQFGNKMVKVKIDGIESEVPLSDVIRGYQTDQHLTQKGQTVADEKRMLSALIDKLQPGGQEQVQQRKSGLTEKPPEIEDEFTRNALKPHFDYFSEIIDKQNQIIENLYGKVEGLGPVQYKQSLDTVSSELKQDGFDDFPEYVSRIEQHLDTLSDEDFKRVHNMEGYKQLYYRMKTQDMVRGASPKPGVKAGGKRTAPKIVKVEETTSRASNSGVNPKKQRLTKTFGKAINSGKNKDWGDVVRQIEEGLT